MLGETKKQLAHPTGILGVPFYCMRFLPSIYIILLLIIIVKDCPIIDFYKVYCYDEIILVK